MQNFWQKLKKPIYALAPMAGVADSAFRQICKGFGAAVVYSEMVSATAVVYDSKKTFALMEFAETERPFVIQLFGSRPEHFALAAKIIEKKVKPDGIDINFGCPVKKVARQCAGAVLMNDLKLARKIIAATIKNTKLPLSLKCRAGAGQVDVLKFLTYLSDLDIKAVIIHGRTMAQGYGGEINWKIIKQARPLVKGILLANGGVKDKASAQELLRKTGADGVSIGQGALGKPWIFENVKSQPARTTDIVQSGGKSKVKSKEEIFKIMLKHAELANQLKGKQGIVEMRKHLCWYVKGWPEAGDLRKKFVKAESLAEVRRILK